MRTHIFFGFLFCLLSSQNSTIIFGNNTAEAKDMHWNGVLICSFIIPCNILAENYFLKCAKLLFGSPGLCSQFSVSDFCLICSNTGIDIFHPDSCQLNCSYRKCEGYQTVFTLPSKVICFFFCMAQWPHWFSNSNNFVPNKSLILVGINIKVQEDHVAWNPCS